MVSVSLFDSSHKRIVDKVWLSTSFGSFLRLWPQIDDLISWCVWPRLVSSWWRDFRNRVWGKNWTWYHITNEMQWDGGHTWMTRPTTFLHVGDGWGETKRQRVAIDVQGWLCPWAEHWFSTGGERRVCRKTYRPDFINKGHFIDSYVWQGRKKGLELQYLKSNDTPTTT